MNDYWDPKAAMQIRPHHLARKCSKGNLRRTSGYSWNMSGTSNLAVLGAEPHFSVPLHVGRPNIGDRKRLFDRLEEVLDSGWLTNDGPMVREFEESIASLSQARHCIAVSNGTMGLQIVSRALALEGEVVVPSFTFVATPHSLRWQGLVPAFADITLPFHSIGGGEAAAKVTSETSAIVAVRTWGLPVDEDALEGLAAEKGVALVMDSAHALACGWLGRTRRILGRAEVLSFHATKFLNTFEGGAILTDDDELAESARLIRNFGFRGFDRVDCLGINGKMSEPCAAMGLTNLESMDRIIARNVENHTAYTTSLQGVSDVSVICPPEAYQWNYQYVVALVGARCPLSRDDLVRVLMAENVLARRYFFPGAHRMEPYRSEFRLDSSLPVTEEVCRRVMVLPTGTSVTPADANAIGQIIRRAIEAAPAVLRSLGEFGTLTGAVPPAALSPLSDSGADQD
jgi:dTDP-4-amino-4,6-dideoxygalactose transaminase